MKEGAAMGRETGMAVAGDVGGAVVAPRAACSQAGGVRGDDVGAAASRRYRDDAVTRSTCRSFSFSSQFAASQRSVVTRTGSACGGRAGSKTGSSLSPKVDDLGRAAKFVDESAAASANSNDC